MAKPLYDVGDTVLVPCKIDKIIITAEGVHYMGFVPLYSDFEHYSLTSKSEMVIAQKVIVDNNLKVIISEDQK